MTQKSSISGADIVVPPFSSSKPIDSGLAPAITVSAADIGAPDDKEPTIDETTMMFRRLRRLKSDCAEVGNHQRATMLITACIEEGMDTRVRIIGAMRQLGLNHNHVVAALIDCTGSNSVHHLWQCGPDGIYTLHPA